MLFKILYIFKTKVVLVVSLALAKISRSSSMVYPFSVKWSALNWSTFLILYF